MASEKNLESGSTGSHVETWGKRILARVNSQGKGFEAETYLECSVNRKVFSVVEGVWRGEREGK